MEEVKVLGTNGLNYYLENLLKDATASRNKYIIKKQYSILESKGYQWLQKIDN